MLFEADYKLQIQTTYLGVVKIIHKTLNTGNKRIKYICVGILDTLFR